MISRTQLFRPSKLISILLPVTVAVTGPLSVAAQDASVSPAALLAEVWANGLDGVLAHTPDPPAALADFLLRSGRRADALRLYNQLADRHPDEPGVWVRRGEAYLAVGRVSDAMTSFQRGRGMQRANPDTTLPSAEVLNRRIALLEWRDELNGAAGVYQSSGGRRMLLKYDPFLGTYPQLIDLDDGSSRVLYPEAERLTFEVRGSGSLNGERIRLEVEPGEDAAIVLSSTGGAITMLVRRTLHQKSVVFENGVGNRLAGTLYIPDTLGPHPTILMVQGAGPSTRYSIAIEAIALADAGYSTLVFDKRGTGASEGPSWLTLTIDDQVDDARAALDRVLREPTVDSSRIGVWGFSQGGWVAPLVAARDDRVAFVILASGAATGVYEQTVTSTEAVLREAGAVSDAVAAAGVYERALFEAISGGASLAELKHMRDSLPDEPWVQYVQRPTFQFEIDWWRHNAFDPASTLAELEVPILSLFGERDQAVVAEVNFPLMADYLARAPSGDVTLVVVPDADHTFVLSDETPRISPDYFIVMTKWLKRHFH